MDMITDWLRPGARAAQVMVVKMLPSRRARQPSRDRFFYSPEYDRTPPVPEAPAVC
jgi:hypothetical protein